MNKYIKFIVCIIILSLAEGSGECAAANKTAADKLKDNILFFKKTACNGAIVGLTQMPDIVFNGKHQGKCIPYVGEIVQMLTNNTALVSGLADDTVYVKFPKNFKGINRGGGIAFYGLCKLNGFYKYTTVRGVKQTVLNLQLIREFTLDESLILYDKYLDFNALGTLTSPVVVAAKPINFLDNFIVNDNETVTDKRTHLVWQQGEGGAMTWKDAVSYCQELTVAGSNDWRLPNQDELLWLADETYPYPYRPLYAKIFPKQFLNCYWSSGDWGYDGKWVMDFNVGKLTPRVYNEGQTNYVRCVRGGPDGKVLVSASRFSDKGNGTVTERGSHLIWQQEGTAPMSWDAAATYCTELTLAGSNDWRLPKDKELISLYYATKDTPSTNPTVYLGLYPSEYWSSSESAKDRAGYVVFNLRKLKLDGDNKTIAHYVRCVRGEQ